MAMTHEEKDKVLAEKDAQLTEKDAQIAALMAEVEAMKADKEAQAAEDAKQPEDAKKTVRIKLYKDERIVNDQEVFVNGKPYLIQRGVDVDVPLEVAEVLKNQERMKAQIAAYNAKHADKN